MSDMPGQKEDSGHQPTGFRNVAAFVNNAQDGTGKKPDLLEMPSIILPKGGGAIRSIDEKFAVNAANGTASCSIPLPYSPGRKGGTPDWPLQYSSGSGNNPFGLGWSLEIPSIQRRTEKELPQYRDAEESDTFIFSGAEDLVPLLTQDAQGNWSRKTSTEGSAVINYYRPRIESAFARIEQWNDGGNIYWRVRTKDNIVSVFGQGDETKLFSPVPEEGKNKIFRWCLEYSYDDKGNFIHYTYKKENKDNVIASLSEKNHLNDLAPFTNIYCKSIKYGNQTAWYADGTPGAGGTDDALGMAAPTDFMFELVFDYGEHDADKPNTTEITPWSVRQDPFSDFRAGFEIRTYRLCRRILMFHHFQEELGWQDYLVRSMELSYEEHPHLTYLSSIGQTGYIWNTDGSLRSSQSIPPQEFSYFEPGYSREVKEVTTDNIMQAPAGVDEMIYQWTDLYSEGIQGILSEQAGGWFYKENLGNGVFSPAQIVSPRPLGTGLSEKKLAIQDLEGDGLKYLVSMREGLRGYYPLSPEYGPGWGAGGGLSTGGGWHGFRAFEKYPNIDLLDPNLKFLDLNGDGMADMLLSQDQEFIWYTAKGKIGYDDYHLAIRAPDEEKGPQVLFADKDTKMLIATADMSGDGLPDIVLITYAQACYYPNLGYGRFGARVTLEMEGIFAPYTEFDPLNLLLADIDGSGTTDLVYIGGGTIRVWFNQSGNRLSSPSDFFNPFPELDDQSKISLIDLLGTGVPCLVWSSTLPSQSRAPLRYIDLMGGKKPHILYGYKNNRGKEVTLEYKSSTQYYLTDKQAGNSWLTRLPFPVQCVSKVTVVDKVAQTRFTNEYSYHHGYYDAREREFRGFARVEQRDSEKYDQFVKATQAGGAANTTEQDLYQPAVITKTWYHTGAWLHRKQLFHQLQQEYYPQSLISSGQLDSSNLIKGVSDYFLDDQSILPEGLEPSAISECYRALKGLPLRQEVYGEEGDATAPVSGSSAGTPVALSPYTVTQHNYDIQLLQPRAGQPYAVFLPHEKESLTFNFERNPIDPRVIHTINAHIDPYGNVLESASIVYGRKKPDASLPTDADRQQQTRQHIVYAQYSYTTPIDLPSAYRLPVSFETQNWELNIAPPAATFFTGKEIDSLFSGATIVLYEQTAGINQKRKLKHTRTLFLKNDFTAPAPLGSQDTLGLPYENYILAFTPTLAADIYGGKFDDSLWRNKGMYINFLGDSNYWIRSGKMSFGTDINIARSNFYQPAAFEDNFGYQLQVFYDARTLFMQRTVDAANNEMNVTEFNYRTLLPWLIKDSNDNRTGVRFDELGQVIRTFVMGKTGEAKGDPIDESTTELSSGDQPTTTLEYTFRYYSTNGQLPDRVKTSIREQHYYAEPLPAQTTGGISGWLKKIFGSGGNAVVTPAADVAWQNNYSYFSGSGQSVLSKIQAEPGLAPQRDAGGQLIYDSSGNPKQVDTTPDLRFIGNGRTIFNNKGKPVKQYEPYFDSSPEYNTEEELVELGFTDILYYDALGRLIRTDRPNGAFSKIAFDAWQQKTYDENDTVMDSDWYQARIGGALGEAEQQAAQKAALHAGTPSITYLDSLGHSFLTIADNKTQRSNETVLEEFYYTRKTFDPEGHVLSVIDARSNVVMTWKYDMAGNIGYQHSMDAGDRWRLADVMGKPLSLWDSRQQIFSYTYDALHRPLTLKVNTGAADTTYEQFQYGEGVTDDKKDNLRGKLYKHNDTAGLVTSAAYDFKGNLLGASRNFLKDYKNIPDWATTSVLETESFEEETAFDALNRPVQQVTADGSVFQIGYNAGGLLDNITVRIRGVAAITSFVTKIDYNAKRQRELIQYGNATKTSYAYDPTTYRLIRILTTARNGGNVLQDLNYTYDPIGNITRQFDNAQKTIFYGGQQIAAQSDYIYDAIYRLIEATGREHTGQIGANAGDNYNDSWCRLSLQPNSPIQLRNYVQKYFYDGAGNILKMQHIAAGPASWTRTYQYNPANNQLTKTSVSGQNYTYTYNQHGSMITMPQLTGIDWNFREELQHAGLGGGGDVYYVYDSQGQRVRKVVIKAGSKTVDRLYLGAVELYRERTGNTITLERQTLQVMDDRDRIAMIDSRTKGNDGSPAQLIRYQYNDHLDSAALELDDSAKIISYEEYHPYGTTAYQATDASRQVPAKRYRYTGMERDEESGLNYHTRRYYIPWLGRWTAVDPLGVGDNANLYAYCSGRPTVLNDTRGMEGDKPPEELDHDAIKKIIDTAAQAVKDALKEYAQAQKEALEAIAKEKQAEKGEGGMKETKPGTVEKVEPPPEGKKEEDLKNKELIAADKNKIKLGDVDDPYDPVTPGLDTQVGGSGVGLATDSAKYSFDYLQLTALPRNWEIIPLYHKHDIDFAALKEPGVQLTLQEQPKDTGRGREGHTTLGGSVDILNFTYDPGEIALTGGGGYDFTGHNVALTLSLGGKLTLVENKLPILSPFGTNKLRLYGGVGIEGDIPTRPGAPSGFGGISVGGGILIEWNPFEKKKKE